MTPRANEVRDEPSVQFLVTSTSDLIRLGADDAQIDRMLWLIAEMAFVSGALHFARMNAAELRAESAISQAAKQ